MCDFRAALVDKGLDTLTNPESAIVDKVRLLYLHSHIYLCMYVCMYVCVYWVYQ